MSTDARRLLAICNLAANVRTYGATADFSSPYWNVSGIIDVPTASVSGVDGINAALVCKLEDATVVCYRATLPPDDETRPAKQRLEDWIGDFHARLIEWTGSCDVHEGFAAAVDSLDVLDNLPLDQPVIFCGHSKGAAMAALAAFKFWMQMGGIPKVVTWGGPRAGGHSFSDSFSRSPIEMTRYECAADVVPRLPLHVEAAAALNSVFGLSLPAFDYESVGTASYLSASGEPQAETTRIADIAFAYATGGFKAIREAHGIGYGSAYATAVGLIERQVAA